MEPPLEAGAGQTPPPQPCAIMLRRPNTKNATRIPVARELVDTLRDLAGASIPHPAERIFGLSDIRAAWRRAVRGAGLEGTRGLVFHSLRHTFATRYLAAGGNVYDLKTILGHADILTTMKYLHDSDERIRYSMRALSYGDAPTGTLRGLNAPTERTQGAEGGEGREAPSCASVRGKSG